MEALRGIVSVSRETAGHLETYVELLRKWQKAENLVAPATLDSVWQRHIADSAQLLQFFPGGRIWLDLGCGAGLPGLVLAILMAASDRSHVHLVESNQRKCAFLREVIRRTGAAAEVHCGRIESVLGNWSAPVEMVSARALAPLDRIFAVAEPVLSRPDVAGAFHKGRDFAREIDEASKSWSFDLVVHKSLVEGSGVILEIRGLRRKDDPGA
jgi:16S rRNA (guanine527-N7)-methyltransferase